MRKGFKFKIPRAKEHNEKIGMAVSKAFTETRKKWQSDKMKQVWQIIKNENE